MKPTGSSTPASSNGSGARATPPADRARVVNRAIPVAVDIAGQWAWRVLAVVAVLTVIGFLIARLEEIVVPFLIALLVSALLVPFVNFLHRHHWPRWLAIVVSLLILLVVVSSLLFLIVTQIRSGLPHLEKQSMQSYRNFREFLRTSSLHVTNTDFAGYLTKIGAAIQTDSKAILSGVASIGSTAGHLLTGTLLTLFATIFMLIDGGGVWRWVVRLFPKLSRDAVEGAGEAGWLTLTTFVRVQVFVAAVDAVGIGLFAFFLGLPLAIPISIIVFLASFIPVVGAIVSGILAVLVALVFVGPLQAIIMLGGVLLVHLLEAHVLQPLVMGSAIRVHPLAVVFAVAAGSFIAGVPGALFAVPTVAVINVMVTYVARGEWRHPPDSTAERAAADSVVPSEAMPPE